MPHPDEEDWRPVVGWEGLYDVSSYGRVRSARTLGPTRYGKILKLFHNQDGYPSVHLCQHSKYVTRRVGRLVGEAFLPNFRTDLEIDHIDGNRANDCLTNLRMVTSGQNTINRGKQKNNTTGAIGVHFHKRLGRYTVAIGIDKVQIHLGCFDDLIDAKAAYDAAAKRYFGEFRRGANDAAP